MVAEGKTIEILIADDDAEDRMFIIDALKENKIMNKIQEVENGENGPHLQEQGGAAKR